MPPRHVTNGCLLIALAIAAAPACTGDEPPVDIEATELEPEPQPVASVPTPPPPYPEPVAPSPTADADVEDSEPDIQEAPEPHMQRASSDSLALTPAFRVGDTFRRNVDWSSITEIRINAGDGVATSLLDSSIETTYNLRVAGVDKGAPSTVEVRFETFSRLNSGRPTELSHDPATDHVWSCRADATPAQCANTRGEIFDAPPWLALTFTPLMPARFVRPAETWSRRIDVAPTLGLPANATARATLQAEAPYQRGDDLLSTATVEFDADVLVEAFGRPIRMRGTGTAAMEIDLGARRVVALDAEWTGQARARGRATDGALDFDRETSITLRVTELDDN